MPAVIHFSLLFQFRSWYEDALNKICFFLFSAVYDGFDHISIDSKPYAVHENMHGGKHTDSIDRITYNTYAVRGIRIRMPAAILSMKLICFGVFRFYLFCTENCSLAVFRYEIRPNDRISNGRRRDENDKVLMNSHWKFIIEIFIEN